MAVTYWLIKGMPDLQQKSMGTVSALGKAKELVFIAFPNDELLRTPPSLILP